MESSGGCLRRPVILCAFFGLALSLGAAVAANSQVGVGTDITKIIGVNYMGADQWVEIANEGTGSMNLTGWTLMNMKNQTCSFPAGFTLNAGSIVEVHTGKGDNTAADLFNSALVWDKRGDTAILKDATGKIVSEYKYPIKVSAQGSVTEIKPSLLPKAFSIGGTSPTFQPGYISDYSAERGSLKSNFPVNLSGRPFICHGGALNWAWTTGLRLAGEGTDSMNLTG
jgi:hypothetical protein